MRAMILLASLALLAGASPPAPLPAAPNWMAGAWASGTGKEWSDEFWSPMRGGVMLGAARIGEGDGPAMWEQTRIMRNQDGSFSFWASPRGVPASHFPMVAQEAMMIEFANAAHDYPQRIRYWREGRLLKARISMMDGRKAQEWTYRPMGEAREGE